MKRRVYLLGQFAADTFRTRKILDRGGAHAVQTAEGGEQTLAPCGTDAGNVLQP